MSVLPLILDGWQNTMTGLGTLADKLRATVWSSTGGASQNAGEYNEIYEKSWLSRAVVDTFPEQALRKRPTIKDVEKQDDLWKKYDALNNNDLYPSGVLLQGLCQGRLHGGAVVIAGFKRGDPEQPVPETFGPLTEIVWLDVVCWEDLSVKARETDRNSPRFGLPVILEVQGNHTRRGYRFHASRAIFCEGAPRAKIDQQIDMGYSPWISVLDPVIDELKRFDEAWQSVGHLLSEASIGVLKLAGLVAMLSSKDEAAVRSRMQLMSQGRSVARTVFLDAELNEDFSRTEVSFASLDKILQQSALQVSGSTRIPVALLFGQAPAGLNATGESDMRQFYDRVAEYQRKSVRPKQERLMSWILGREVSLEYPPIQEATDVERADIRAKNATTDKVYWDMGVIDAIDIAKSRDADDTLGIVIDIVAKKKTLAAEAEREEEQANLLLEAQRTGVEQAGQPQEEPATSGKAPGKIPPKPSKPGAV